MTYNPPPPTLRQRIIQALTEYHEATTPELIALLDDDRVWMRPRVWKVLDEMEDRGKVAGRYDVRPNARGFVCRVVVWRLAARPAPAVVHYPPPRNPGAVTAR